ncbi:hypothetical protein BDS110ZK4_84030 [Bradyrhizobium diazoefficiens]
MVTAINRVDVSLASVGKFLIKRDLVAERLGLFITALASISLDFLPLWVRAYRASTSR